MSENEGDGSGIEATGAAGNEQAAAVGVPQMTLIQMLQEQQRQFLAQQEAQRQAAGEQQAAQQRLIERLMEQQRDEMQRHRVEMLELKERGTSEKVKLPKPTLQKLGEKDDVEHYLATFERIAEQQGWPKDAWATQLAGRLTGKAMAAYAALDTASAGDYEELKQAILRRYDVNEETHRIRFRQDKKRADEPMREWIQREADHFDKWAKDQKMSHRDMIITEQILLGVSDDLTIWLRERRPDSLDELGRLADDYLLARRGESKNAFRRPILPMQTNQGPPRAVPGTTNGRPQSYAGGHRQQGPALDGGRSRTNYRGEKQCFQCGKFGHLMYNCPNRASPSTSAAPKPAFMGKTCTEMAWDAGSTKYLRRGYINGKVTQMLVDTGCDLTMVGEECVDNSQVNYGKTVPVQCVHGDTTMYPTARVHLQIGDWTREAEVAVAPKLPGRRSRRRGPDQEESGRRDQGSKEATAGTPAC